VGFEKAYPKETAEVATEALPDLEPPPAYYEWHGEDEALPYPVVHDKQLPC